MSWQPKQNWQSDGRPSLHRGHVASEDGEEVEESGEMKSPEKTMKKEDDDTEEEGEISTGPPNAAPVRSSSIGSLDYQNQFRGRTPNNPRFGVRDRPRQRNSFSGMPNANPPTFKRDGQQHHPPPSSFRGDPPSYRESPNQRDINDGQSQTLRGGRDYRDFGPPSAGPGQRSDGIAFGNRDFRNEQPRDFRGDHVPPRDFRGPADTSREYRPDRDFRERDRYKRDKFGNQLSLHRDQSFGSRDNSFRDGDGRDGRGGGMPFSSRGSFSRDSSTGPFHRESSRDGKFDDAPNSNKFPMPQMVPSGSVNGLGRGAQAMGPHSNRPTDPRRRPSKDIGHSPAPFGMKTDQGINDGTGNPINADSRHLTGAPSGGPPFSDVSTIPPAPHPARRTSSYSSLADSSSIQSSGGRHWSSVNERGRPGSTMEAPSPSRLQIPKVSMTQQHQPQPSPSQHHRQSISRNNDPRFKQDTSNEGFGRPDQEHQFGSNQSSADPFGRSRDWKDRSFNSRASNTTPRSSPVKQKNIRSFSSTPQADKIFPNMPAPASGTKGTNASETLPSRPRNNSDQVLPPLSTSVLGDEETIRKAQSAMKHLCDIVSGADLNDMSVLPKSKVIMRAITEIDNLTKETQKKFDSLQDDKSRVLKEEETERKEKAVRQAEEEVQRQIEKSRLEAEAMRQEEKEKESSLKKVLEESRDSFLEAKRAVQKEFDDYVVKERTKEKEQFFEELEEQMAEASINFEKDIGRAQRDLEKAKSVCERVESKFATVESEYKSLLESQNGDGVSKEAPKEASSELSDLIHSVTANNKRKASEAQIFSSSLVRNTSDVKSDIEELLQISTDPKYDKTNEEWSLTASRVSSLNDALFSEPSECPYFEHGERNHSILGTSVKEYVRHRQKRLLDRWTELAEEYEVRRRLYEKQQKKLAKKGQQKGAQTSGKKSIFGEKNESERAGIDRSNVLETSGRTSNNPYRRARRGNEVRSEYEQEQIIAELAAKEAMEKRINHGGSKVPRQICHLERENTASFLQTFTAQKVDDPVLEEKKEASINLWSDMEKCIFLDRFLQFPKDFRRIASFLRNKTTKDCIAFYYDSKQTVPYKGALKEHMMRRKRKGDYQVWDASIQAAISVGAVVTAGSSEEKPLVFSLPSSDRTFSTKMLHPLKREVLDTVGTDIDLAKISKADLYPDETKSKSRKRDRDPLFSIDKEQTKFLRMTSQESITVNQAESNTPTPPRKAPQKWTAAEKKIFVETLEEHGHGKKWEMLSRALKTKSISQIKNFYYDYKKQSGKSKDKKDSKASKSKVEEASNEDSEYHILEQAKREAALLADSENSMSAALSLQLQLAMENPADLANQELIQQLVAQQVQQNQMQLGQLTPSALQQLLSQQQHAQIGQLSPEDALRLLQQQSQSRHQQVLSSILPDLAAWQLLQNQSRLQLLQQHESSQLPSSVSDLAELQHLLQLQQASQHPYGHNPLSSLLLSGGMSSSATSGLSAGLLSQLETLPGSSIGSETNAELSALINSQRLLNSSLARRGLYNQGAGVSAPNMESTGVDALTMLARAIPRGEEGNVDQEDNADR